MRTKILWQLKVEKPGINSQLSEGRTKNSNPKQRKTLKLPKKKLKARKTLKIRSFRKKKKRKKRNRALMKKKKVKRKKKMKPRKPKSHRRNIIPNPN